MFKKIKQLSLQIELFLVLAAMFFIPLAIVLSFSFIANMKNEELEKEISIVEMENQEKIERKGSLDSSLRDVHGSHFQAKVELQKIQRDLKGISSITQEKVEEVIHLREMDRHQRQSLKRMYDHHGLDAYRPPPTESRSGIYRDVFKLDD